MKPGNLVRSGNSINTCAARLHTREEASGFDIHRPQLLQDRKTSWFFHDLRKFTYLTVDLSWGEPVQLCKQKTDTTHCWGSTDVLKHWNCVNRTQTPHPAGVQIDIQRKWIRTQTQPTAGLGQTSQVVSFKFLLKISEKMYFWEKYWKKIWKNTYLRKDHTVWSWNRGIQKA